MAYTALYRRYRPSNFDGVVGQQSVTQALKNQVKQGRISHAYLFCGPRGIGKTSVARIFARAINCQDNHEGEACGTCPACTVLSQDNNMDIIEIDAASNNGVDNVRELRENIKYMPAAGKYRVYIIDEVHMLSKSAFNALLKTLEEPPGHIVFIMATTEPKKLPVTVLSRCQRYDFKRVDTGLIAGLLKEVAADAGINIDDKAITAIARSSEGGIRDALSLLDQCFAFGDETVGIKDVNAMLGSADRLLYFAMADAILNGDLKRALTGISKMIESGCNVLSVAEDLQQHFRDLFIAHHVKDVGAALMVDDTTAQRFQKQAGMASDGTLLRCMEIFSTLEGDLRFATAPRIWVELALGKACRVEKVGSYQSLLERVERLEKRLDSWNFKASAKHIDEQEEYFPHKDSDFEEDYVPPVEEPYMPEEQGRIDEPTASQPEPIIDSHEPIIEQPAPKVEEEKPVEPVAEPEAPMASGSPKTIWQKAIDAIQKRRKMRICIAMQRGRASTINGAEIIILFPPDAHASIDSLQSEAARMELLEVLKEVSGQGLIPRFKVEELSEEDQRVLDQVTSMFPDDIIEVNYDD